MRAAKLFLKNSDLSVNMLRYNVLNRMKLVDGGKHCEAHLFLNAFVVNTAKDG